MTKQNFMKYYNKLTGADSTIIFFERKGSVYKTERKHIPPRWVKEGRESSSKGGQQKFRMYISAKEKDLMIDRKKDIEFVMTTKEFNELKNLYKNKGHRCEYILHRDNNMEYTPDTLRFDKGGDIEIKGVKYQVKFQNASLTNVDVLHKAQKDARKK